MQITTVTHTDVDTAAWGTHLAAAIGRPQDAARLQHAVDALLTGALPPVAPAPEMIPRAQVHAALRDGLRGEGPSDALIDALEQDFQRWLEPISRATSGRSISHTDLYDLAGAWAGFPQAQGDVIIDHNASMSVADALYVLLRAHGARLDPYDL